MRPTFVFIALILHIVVQYSGFMLLMNVFFDIIYRIEHNTQNTDTILRILGKFNFLSYLTVVWYGSVAIAL